MNASFTDFSDWKELVSVTELEGIDRMVSCFYVL